MAKINILPAKVYNRIAAGEVVDRPYSVVKELVENAIDAGATEIEIHVENGGKQLVRVIDNGCGIEREDLQSAFLPHATSKISRAEDLENIVTLGFRGEAVASIAAVSQMTITSRVEGEKCYSLSSNGGELGSIVEASGDKGTDVRVEMLFFNTPVRLEFLKSDKTEEADITTFVSRFILNRSDIAFTYYLNGKKVLQSFGGGDEEALVCVYGAAVRAQCIEIDGERHGIRVRGYIGNQNFHKPNKSYQSVFLNGRYVSNATISAAISGAYANYLMKRQYPFCVLHVDVPPQIVDVNVHPNKADVRFADNQVIYGAIYKIIGNVLDGSAQALEYVVPPKAFAEEVTQLPLETKTLPIEPVAPVTKTQPVKSLSEEILGASSYTPVQSETAKPSVFETDEKKKTFGFATLTYEEAQKEIEACSPLFDPVKMAKRAEERLKEKSNVIPYDQIPDVDPSKLQPYIDGSPAKKNKPHPEKLLKHFPDLTYQVEVMKMRDSEEKKAIERKKAKDAEMDHFAENKKYLEELDKKAQQRKIDVTQCAYVGKAFNTYLFYQYQDSILMIDQHAAHERLIFNRLKEKMRNRAIVRQPMLLPYELSTNPLEAAFLRTHLADIKAIGFDVEESETGKFVVSAIPADLQNMQIGAFFDEILGDINNYRGIKIDEILKDKLATAACKAAVKGGMDISQEEITELLKQMDGDIGMKCPHGRPVVVELSKTEIEKMFKRIV